MTQTIRTALFFGTCANGNPQDILGKHGVSVTDLSASPHSFSDDVETFIVENEGLVPDLMMCYAPADEKHLEHMAAACAAHKIPLVICSSSDHEDSTQALVEKYSAGYIRLGASITLPTYLFLGALQERINVGMGIYHDLLLSSDQQAAA